MFMYMPITKSAEKAMRGSLRKKAVNDRRKRAMKEVIKKIDKSVKTDKKRSRENVVSCFQGYR